MPFIFFSFLRECEFFFVNFFWISFIIPAFLIVFLLFTSSTSNNLFVSFVNLYGSSFLYVFSLVLLYNINCYDIFFKNFKFIYFSEFFDWPLIIGFDNLSILFICLTNLLIFSCFLYNHNNITFGARENSIFLFLMQLFLNLFFVSTNLFWFFIYFECVLIPMFFLIGL